MSFNDYFSQVNPKEDLSICAYKIIATITIAHWVCGSRFAKVKGLILIHFGFLDFCQIKHKMMQ